MDLIVAHGYADLDAVASLVAANELYPEAICLRNARVSSLTRRYLALHRDVLDLRPPSEIDPERVEQIVVVDTRKAGRLAEYSELLEHATRLVIWDHHPASPDDLEADELHVEPVGACTTLLVEAIRDRDISISAREATLMVLGIYADTGRLSYRSTTARDAEAVAHLLRCGAELDVVNRYLRDEFTPQQRHLFTEMMYGSESLEVQGARITVATADVDDFVEGAADVVEHLMEMGNDEAMLAALAFGANHVQLIGRSRVPYVDVGAILSEFGGGGHASAAGASTKDLELDEVVDRLERVLAESDIAPTRVRDLMSSPVRIVERSTTLRECRELLDKWGVTGAPVAGADEKVEGIISRRDVERAARENRLDLPVSSHMSQEPILIDPDASLEEALDVMTDREVGRLPVCDGGRLVGIVTRTDVRRVLYDAADSESPS